MNETPANEALAVQAKAGDREALAALWEQNRGLLALLFRRLAAAYRERMDAAGVTLEDLEQEGYFAVAKAAKLYDPSAGAKFSTFLYYPVKNVFACAVGLRTERQRQEPLCRCDSLDAPLDAEDNGSATRGDTVPDAAAEQAFNDADECLYTAQLHSALDDALALLDERKATVLRVRFYEGRTLESLAVQLGISRERVRQTESKAIRAMRFPRIQRKLEAYRENILSGSSYHGTGFSAWKERGSVEERLAERIEAYAERGTTNAFISDVMRIRGCSREEVLQRYPELSS
ncbi:sigma-70 family RNA polymerase sigma factor [Ruthenibacterium lactatiformans]|uniref:sigma-70 family RNA polymerase sigma factor n=1 Tax=Ruthenibacterium lactatiformans TaxID=1550024 RepID=UPI0019670088|nr:sigma-70 family RNA polymerase sigma factor [Ruthenibacterium lactatiformans]MBN3018775.1 sigma-70 family RNA polymerase sigma factor [Ruthenibacterium lactatiformans]